jgi:hypothetical protein
MNYSRLKGSVLMAERFTPSCVALDNLPAIHVIVIARRALFPTKQSRLRIGDCFGLGLGTSEKSIRSTRPAALAMTE